METIYVREYKGEVIYSGNGYFVSFTPCHWEICSILNNHKPWSTVFRELHFHPNCLVRYNCAFPEFENKEELKRFISYLNSTNIFIPFLDMV